MFRSVPFRSVPFRSVPWIGTTLVLLACGQGDWDLSPKSAEESRPVVLGGAGTTDEPWRVETCDELNALDDDPDGHFALTADLTCDGVVVQALGARRPFSGTLDGRGHTISGLAIEHGLFQRTHGARIARLSLRGGVTWGRGPLGVLVGDAARTEVDQVAVVDVFIDVQRGFQVGGLVGRAEDTVIRDSYALVEAPPGTQLGGLLGTATRTRVARSYAVSSQAAGVVQGRVHRHVELSDAFFDAEVALGSAPLDSNGAAETDELQSLPFLESVGWDFDAVWGFRGLGYPCLRWEQRCGVVRFAVDPSMTVSHQDRDYAGVPLPMARLEYGGVGFEYFEDILVVEARADGIDTALAPERLSVLDVDHPEPWDDSDNMYLVQTTSGTPDCDAELEELLRAEEPGLDGVLAFSSERARATFCVLLRMLRAGSLVDLDGPMDEDTYTRGSSNISCLPGAGCQVVARSKNVFDWVDFGATRSGGFSIPQAWEALEATGATAHVTANIADHGFVRTPDFDGEAGESFVPFQGLFESSRWGTAWHGAACAAALSAVPDNDWGVVGTGGRFVRRTVIWGIENHYQVRRAMRHARRQNGASILSISNSYERPRRLRFLGRGMERTAVRSRDRGTLIFASAGNDDDELAESDSVFRRSERRRIPCELDGVECVGGLDSETDARHPDSNWGPRVDLFAPYQGAGFDATRQPLDEIATFNGTSYATPFVAGVAALVWTADPTLTPDGVADILRGTAVASSDPEVTRVVAPYEAVVTALGFRPPRVDVFSRNEGQTIPTGAPFAIIARLSVGDLPIARVALRSDRLGVLDTSMAPATGIVVLTWTPESLAGGRHVLDVSVEDAAGHVTSQAFEVFVEVPEECPRLTNAVVTLLGSDDYSDSIALEVNAFDPQDGDLAAAVEWFINGTLVADGSPATVVTGARLCSPTTQVVVTVRDSAGCFVAAPVSNVTGCP